MPVTTVVFGLNLVNFLLRNSAICDGLKQSSHENFLNLVRTKSINCHKAIIYIVCDMEIQKIIN